MPSGLLAECVIEGGDHRGRWRSQQPGQPIKNRIEERMRIPGTARAETVIGAPIDKLTPDGADGSGGQMQTQTDQHAEGEPPPAPAGAPLRETGARDFE